ncbi:MAG: hypothetical protein ACYS9V_13450 [Planctomycetota bacterium]|jgi:hypothetical protein
MATTTGTMNFYDKFKEFMGDNTIDMDDAGAGAFKCLLTTSAHTPLDTHQNLTSITNEVTGNGYARQNLASVTWADAAGTTTWDAANVVFSATGGSWTARNYHIYYDTGAAADADRELVIYGLLDQTPADVTVTDGNTLTLQWNISGIFTLTG